MNRAKFSPLSIGLFFVVGCASSNDAVLLSGERSVFHNPYVAPELVRGPVGPDQCENRCLGDRYLPGLHYPGRGNIAYDQEGNRVRVSREQRRVLQERSERIEAQAEANARRAQIEPKTLAQDILTAPRN